MKAVWLSDLHMEFHKDHDRMLAEFILSLRDYDCIFITGDTDISTNIVEMLEFIKIGSNLSVYFVCGNHDFYKGSLYQTRQRLKKLDNYLSYTSFVSLTQKTAIVGHDGWYDGGYGDYFNSSVELNDFYQINEFIGLSKSDRLSSMEKLAIRGNNHIIDNIVHAFMEHDKVVVLTHVPPFKENSLYRGKQSDENFLPFYANKDLGKRLKYMADNFPAKELLILSGHTHAASEYAYKNIVSLTQDAQYGFFPKLNILEV